MSQDRGRDWALVLALVLTTSWLTLGLVYIGDLIGWSRFATQPVADLGQFLEGAFAPLAFLWLVIGQFQQQRELLENNRAIQRQFDVMQRTAEHAEVQARAVSANELHARQDTFIELAAMVTRQCSATLGLLYGSSQGPAGSGRVSAQEFAELWHAHGAGDPEVFARAMFGLVVVGNTDETPYELFYGTPTRTRHTENVYHAFGRLLRNAAECDPDGMITDALRGSPLGRVHGMIEHERAAWLAAGSPNVPS